MKYWKLVDAEIPREKIWHQHLLQAEWVIFSLETYALSWPWARSWEDSEWTDRHRARQKRNGRYGARSFWLQSTKHSKKCPIYLILWIFEDSRDRSNRLVMWAWLPKNDTDLEIQTWCEGFNFLLKSWLVSTRYRDSLAVDDVKVSRDFVELEGAVNPASVLWSIWPHFSDIWVKLACFNQMSFLCNKPHLSPKVSCALVDEDRQ